MMTRQYKAAHKILTKVKKILHFFNFPNGWNEISNKNLSQQLPSFNS